jgi:hypothetical protein
VSLCRLWLRDNRASCPPATYPPNWKRGRWSCLGLVTRLRLYGDGTTLNNSNNSSFPIIGNQTLRFLGERTLVRLGTLPVSMLRQWDIRRHLPDGVPDRTATPEARAAAYPTGYHMHRRSLHGLKDWCHIRNRGVP